MTMTTFIRQTARTPLLIALACIVSLAACATASQKDDPRAVNVWVTTGDKTRLLQHETSLHFEGNQSAQIQIDVDATVRYQSMVGFGAAITDATAWLMQNRMSVSQRQALLEELFGRGEKGVGFDFTRLTVGASDFSRSHYSLDDMPKGEVDMSLAHFSIDPNRADVIPVVRQALAINPKLQIMASPWSAPGWMKTNDKLKQGQLKPEMYGVFADYLIRYIDAYAKEGIPISTLTLQNEPHFEPDSYPSMRLEDRARAQIVGQHLGPKLARRGLKTQIIEWDHNWDEPSAPMAVLSDPIANPYVSGVAWHCYDSHTLVQVQAGVHDAFPDKDAWHTECSGGEWKTHWPETLPWMVRNVVIGSTRGWAKGVLMWNLALDENHGPHLGGCEDCRGVVTIDSHTGEVTRNLEYYALAHASKFVRPGAQRIASTAKMGGLDTVAFRNTDDGSIVLLVCNSDATDRLFVTRFEGKSFAYPMPHESIATFVWKP